MGKAKKTWDMSARFLGSCENSDFTRLFAQYSNLALRRYEWKNLPKGITSKRIEQALYKHGQVFFTEDKFQGAGLICLPCSNNGSYNVYGDPINLLVTGYGYTHTYDIDDGVRILDNDMIYPLINHVYYYTKKLEDLEYSIARNIKQQNNPYIFSTTKDTEFTIKQVFNKIDRREEAIFMDKRFNDGDGIGIETTDISRPYVVDKYRQEYFELEKELLTMLGLNCIMNKEGGMSPTELNSNNMLIDMYLEIGLQLRRKAVEEINEKFNLNIEVVSSAREMEKMFLSLKAENETIQLPKEEEDNGY